eukprot:3100631-Pyramimonas_sp.AAC.1
MTYSGETHCRETPRLPPGCPGFPGFLGGFAMAGATFPQRKSMDVLGSQGWVSCGGFLVDWPPL